MPLNKRVYICICFICIYIGYVAESMAPLNVADLSKDTRFDAIVDAAFSDPSRCCSVLQYLAACCSVLQCVAVRCGVLQCVRDSTPLLTRHFRIL